MISDAERAARAQLLRAAEPPSVGLVRHVGKVGPIQAVEDIRRHAAIANLDVPALAARLLDVPAERELELAAKLGARLVCPGDDEWPSGLDDLDQVEAGCLALWVRGTSLLADACERAVALVGTRAPTDYGISVAAELGSGLTERGWTVVSGLALGIDAAAHRASLTVGGPTVAVLACGVDVAYPGANRGLYDRVREHGAVVSEQPPGSAPHRGRFLVRNRLIAALSAGTVVIEAAPRSGARSTARHAAEIFRHVMAVPGPVSSILSAGCHQLLRDRPDTVLVTKVDEVIEQVGPMGAFAERVSGPVRRRDLLGPAVSRAFEAVPVMRPVPSERIAVTAGMRPDAMAAALAALEAAGLVTQSAGGWCMTKAGRDERHGRPGDGTDELALGWW